MDLTEIQTNAFLAQAETLAQLGSSPMWPVYQDLLRSMRAAALEELARADAANFRYWQGVAHAIGEVIDRPARVVAAAAETIEAEQHTNKVRPELRAVVGMGYDTEGDV